MWEKVQSNNDLEIYINLIFGIYTICLIYKTKSHTRAQNTPLPPV